MSLRVALETAVGRFFRSSKIKGGFMAVDRNTSMPEAWKVSRELMQNPQSRIPYIEPGSPMI